VNRSRGARTIEAVHRHLVSRICAVWIIGLILVPYTAPFRTIDPDSTHNGSHDGLPKAGIGSDEKATAPTYRVPISPDLSAVVVSHFLAHSQIAEHFPLFAVLRL